MIIAIHSEIAMMLRLFDILRYFVKILEIKIFFWYLPIRHYDSGI